MGKQNLEGTQNITYLHKNDERRSKYRCNNYTKKGYCLYSLTKCSGSSHCSRYTEPLTQEIQKSVESLQKAKKDSQKNFEGIKMIETDKIHIMPHFLKQKPNEKKSRRF